MRNMSNNIFAQNPTVSIGRTRMPVPQEIKFTGNVGDLIPFYWQEVLPGSTHKISTSKVIRLQTLLTPIMDNLYADTYYFYVPNRLIWEHWTNFCGENSESAWIPETEYTIPQVEAPLNGWSKGTIADYLGIPTGVDNLSVNALPFRAYAKIVEDWYRSETVQDPVLIPVDDATVTGSNGTDYVEDLAKGGMPFVAGKLHDLFSSALPSPQRGPDTQIPLYAGGEIPVLAEATTHDIIEDGESGTHVPLHVQNYTGSSAVAENDGILMAAGWSSSANVYFEPGVGGARMQQEGFVPDNLYASLTAGGLQANATINDLRLAFSVQRFYEQLGKGGSRYISILKSMFGVTSPDARLQRSEYLGGNRIPITVSQVIQQSETGSTPQGNTTGMSLTTDVNVDFTHSFTEHGYIIGCLVLRYPHTYQQGLERMWSRKVKFDYYWPTFAHIGNVGIRNSEIYAQGSAVTGADGITPVDDEIFGYAEAWFEYRFKPNRVAAEMRSNYSQSLDSWHLADDYDSLPTLSPDWIHEDKSNVDRVLAVASSNADQFLADILVRDSVTQPMPLYSIPGMGNYF